MAGKFETWARSWRIAWNGIRGGAWLGAVGAILGDRMVTLGTYAVRQRHPEYAEMAIARSIAAERGIEPGSSLSLAQVGELARIGATLNRLRGTSLGQLIALYYTGFADAILVQQNGRGFQITGTPDFADIAETELLDGAPSWVTITTLGAGPPAVSGHPWWTFDLDYAWCSRFGVLFPASSTVDLTVAANLYRLRRNIAAWKPAKATCMGIWRATAGSVWGLGTWGGGVWGGAVTYYTAE